MKVCIAEKPSVGKEIAFILGAKTRRDGYFEGNGYQVTWTFGHFCELCEPNDYKPHWKKWDLNNLPMLPERFETKVKDNKGVKKQFGVVKKLFKKAKVVINCGDAGQEGELIQRWVIKQAGYKGPVQRLWISSLTPEAIRAGFQNLKDAKDYDNLYYAGSSRAICDWLLGMNATRLYTLRYGANRQVLSVGRVQTPTLAMLVRRHKEIENFVVEPYWELQTTYREVAFQSEHGKFKKKEDGEKLLKQVEGKPFTILSFTKKKGKEHPPRLFDLTGLQVYCNKRFGLTADQTLKIAQRLYEDKLITYPRVDTTFLPEDVYPKVPGILGKLKNYAGFTQPLLGKKIKKTKKVFNNKKVTDHHAIIPTGYEKNLPFKEQGVYDIITRRFIAAFYPECIVNHTTVIGEVDGVKFKATGKEIIDEGWRVVLPAPPKKKKEESAEAGQKGKKEEEEKLMPTFAKGESGPHEPELVEKETKPPKTYTEATLLRSMETAGKKVEDDELRELMKDNGIGRPSTRAAIIETLFRRKYIQRVKKQILPTSTGVQLIDTINNELLKSAELTGQWERQLKEIEQGKYNPAKFIAAMKQMVSNLVVEVRSAKNVQRIAPSTATKARSKTAGKKKSGNKLTEENCPKCKEGKLLKGREAYGCSRWKENCNFRLPFEFMGKKISDNQLLRLVQKGETVTLKGFKAGKNKLNGTLSFNPDTEVQFNKDGAAVKPKTSPKKPVKKETQIPDPLPCPKCGEGHILRGQKAYGCSRWKEGCDFRFDFDLVRQKAVGKTMSKALVWEILKGKI